MNNNYYFSHDYNARNDKKILKLRSKYSAKGYGIYWMLVEFMAEDNEPEISFDDLQGISLSINEEFDWLKEFVDFCVEIDLFLVGDNTFTSLRMVQHKSLRKKLSESGKKGASKRWNSPPIDHPNAKERKGKESKVNHFHIFKDGTKGFLDKKKNVWKECDTFQELGYDPYLKELKNNL